MQQLRHEGLLLFVDDYFVVFHIAIAKKQSYFTLKVTFYKTKYKYAHAYKISHQYLWL